jgi:hypothetical protein
VVTIHDVTKDCNCYGNTRGVTIILTKRKEMIRYCESFGYGGTTLSNIIANDLTHVSIPIKNGQIIPIIWVFHIVQLIWAFHFIPNTWAFHINVLQLNTNNQIILETEKKAYASPNSSTKSTPKSTHTFVDAILERYMSKYVSLPP